MSTVLSFLLGPDGVLVWLGALVVAAFAYGLKSGKDSQKARQAREEAKARDVADDVENDVGTLTPDQRKEALRKWSRH